MVNFICILLHTHMHTHKYSQPLPTRNKNQNKKLLKNTQLSELNRWFKYSFCVDLVVFKLECALELSRWLG